MIIYRYIFIIYEQAVEIWQAQVMRLGYSRPKESIRSFSMLCGMLFISSWIAGEDLIRAMDCRCYDGIIPSLDLGGTCADAVTHPRPSLPCRAERDPAGDDNRGRGDIMKIILEARDVRYRYPGSREAIKGISFHMRRGEKIALVGPNGAGKSTLLQMFNGMIRPTSGTMLFDNEPIRYDTSSLRQLRKRVGYVLQNPDRQIIAPTVYQDVAFGPANLGYDEQAIRQAVALALRHVGLEGFERRPPHHLSGGEKKRVAIAGVLAMDPDVLVFDEPTSGLDPSGSEDLMELLDELNHDGKTMIISTHDVELAYPWAERAILLLDGQDPSRRMCRMWHSGIPIMSAWRTSLSRLSSNSRRNSGGAGLRSPERKPRSVLDMIHIIENLLHRSGNNTRTGHHLGLQC